jgi:hypothetical protein
MPEKTTSFAEVIESSLSTVSAICWDENNLPPFGSIVKISYAAVESYGIITNIITASADSSRTPYAFKQSLEELHRNQPQIFAFIQTTCTIALTWHSEHKNTFLSSLPVPHPAPLHAWVACAPTQMSAQALTNSVLLEAITEKLDPALVDDCLIAIATKAAQNNMITHDELIGFIEKYSQEINNDLRRAKRFLQHMERILKNTRKTA